jgi:hypothetical protein
VKRTISKKNTPFGTKSKLSSVVRTKIWPTSTTKSSKSMIIRCDFEKTLSRRLKIDDFARKLIYEKRGCEKSFIPIFERHGGIGKQSKPNFNNMAMFSLSRIISLVGMRT